MLKSIPSELYNIWGFSNDILISYCLDLSKIWRLFDQLNQTKNINFERNIHIFQTWKVGNTSLHGEEEKFN